MKTKIIKLIITVISILGLSGLTIPAFADDDCTNPCNCPNIPDEVKIASGCDSGSKGDHLPGTIIAIINGIVGILAVVAVIVIIIGGVQLMTAAGDPAKIKKAKDAIIYAGIGLIIAALAGVIVNFVIAKI